MVYGVDRVVNKWIFRQFCKIRTKFMGFQYVGIGSCVIRPLQIDNPKTILLGNKVTISTGAWLMGNKYKSNVTLVIKDGAMIGHFCHIIAFEHIEIGKNVLIADKVFISDCTHRYSDTDIAIKDSGVEILKNVVIGEESWLGENVCVCGANIGKHCVIGANSVVNTDIPDYCVAVGSPARIVKKYNFDTKMWEDTKYNENISNRC